MFDTLLESRTARRSRTTGGRSGVAVSALLHAALIGGAVAATGRAATVRRDPPPRPLVYVAPPAPAPRARPAAPHESRGGPPDRPSGPAPLPSAVSSRQPLLSLPTVPTGPTLRVAAAPTPDASSTEFSRGGLRGPDANSGRGLGSGDGPWDAATVDRAAAPRPGNPAPRYPDALRAAGAEGRVLVRFVVDTSGRVDGGSVQVLRADDSRFADAVRAVLPSLRFAPAEAAGRRVRQLVEAPFAFTIR